MKKKKFNIINELIMKMLIKKNEKKVKHNE